MDKKTILVTGGKGFIGSALVNRLELLGHNVEVLDNRNRTIDNIDIAQFREQDADIVFHLAAESRVQPSFDRPVDTFHTNVTGTANVCQFAVNKGAKLVYAGSSSKHHNPYDSPYASSKWLGEEVVKTYKECYGLNAEIARFYNVYGPGEALDPVNGNVIGIWRYNVEQNLPLKIVGDGGQRRDFTHVDDIVDGLIRIAFKDEKHEDAWELGTGVNYSVNELAGMFKGKFECDVEYIADQPGNYRSTLNTNLDAHSRLGWLPEDKLREHILGL